MVARYSSCIATTRRVVRNTEEDNYAVQYVCYFVAEDRVAQGQVRVALRTVNIVYYLKYKELL